MSGIYSRIFTSLDSLFRAGACTLCFLFTFGLTYTDGYPANAMLGPLHRIAIQQDVSNSTRCVSTRCVKFNKMWFNKMCQMQLDAIQQDVSNSTRWFMLNLTEYDCRYQDMLFLFLIHIKKRGREVTLEINWLGRSIDKRRYKIHLDFSAVKDINVFVWIEAGSNDLGHTSMATEQCKQTFQCKQTGNLLV